MSISSKDHPGVSLRSGAGKSTSHEHPSYAGFLNNIHRAMNKTSSSSAGDITKEEEEAMLAGFNSVSNNNSSNNNNRHHPAATSTPYDYSAPMSMSHLPMHSDSTSLSPRNGHLMYGMPPVVPHGMHMSHGVPMHPMNVAVMNEYMHNQRMSMGMNMGGYMGHHPMQFHPMYGGSFPPSAGSFSPNAFAMNGGYSNHMTD